jgi:preprotein translocase subunit SecE
MRMNRKQRRSEERSGSADEIADSDLEAEPESNTPLAALDGPIVDEADLDDEFTDEPLAGSGRTAGDTLVGDRVARTRPSPERTSGRVRPREFLHEVNVELRKVVWPTRQETINYSSVVLVTLAVLMALIFGLDYGFSDLSNFLFKK